MAGELKIPAVGESISEVIIGAWRKSVGDRVERDEAVVELETDKATFDLPAPTAGVVTKILKQAGETANVGDVIGYVGAAAEKAPQKSPQDGSQPSEPVTAAKAAPAANQTVAGGSQVQRGGPVKEALQEEDDGQVLQDAAPSAPPSRESGSSRFAGETSLVKAAAVPGSGQTAGKDREERVVPMSPIRRRIAQRLVAAQSQAALLTTFNEIDMSAVMAIRKEYKEAFQKTYGVKLGLMSFFVKAVVDGLAATPQINAEIRGNDIVFRNYFDIGIAIGGGKGLVVPVLRNADRLSFAEIEKAIADFSHRAGENKLTVEELQGGTFTISNGGIYGSLLSTPIVNPPQSGVLGMHAIQDRPVARDGNVVIRPMMYVALTYDHRVVDGREAVTFLARVREIVEDPARLLIEV